jgi:uncharacterized membrane protein
MGSWPPLHLYHGWFTFYVGVFIVVAVAIAVYDTRRSGLARRILAIVAAVCIAFAAGQMAAFHIGPQAIEWLVVAIGLTVVFALVLAPFYIRRPSAEEIAAVNARRTAQAVHERLHIGAHAMRYMECEFCRRELGG